MTLHHVNKDISLPFRNSLIACVKEFEVGKVIKKGVFIGSVQNKSQFDRVASFLDDIRDRRQKVTTEGNIIKTGVKDLFTQPTVIDNAQDDSEIVKKEPFKPVVPLMIWSDEREVITRANDTHTGLGALVWSKALDRVVHISETLQAGSGIIN